MRPLVAPLAAVVLLLTATLAAAEVPIAPETTVLRFSGFGTSVASHDADVLALWSSSELRSLFVTRLDPNGTPLGNGHPLPVFWSSPAIGWAGGHFVVAGNDVPHGVTVLAIDRDGQVVIAPRVIATTDYGSSISVTSNGANVLITFVSQSGLIQTLRGVLLDASLNVLHEPFTIATRDVTQPPDHQLSASVASDGNDYLIVWEGTTPAHTLTLKRVTSTGDVVDGPVIVSDRNILSPAIANGVVVWWDGEHLVGQKLPAGAPVLLASAANVASVDVAAADGKVALVWTQTLPQTCLSIYHDHAVLARTFDAALVPLEEAAPLDPAAGQFAYADVTIADGAPLAVWQQAECASGFESVRAGFHAGRVNTISRSVGPSVQNAPDVATDGSALVTVWIEQRGEDLVPRVYAAPLDAAGNPAGSPAAISDTLLPRNPRIAAGGGRFLAIWEDGFIRGRFVRPDGTPDGEVFAIGSGANARMVWDGARFVVAYSENAGIRGAEVSLGGAVRQLGFTGEGTAQNIAELATGPGEVMALIRTESTSRVTLRTVPLRGETWGEPSILATVSRPCPGLACTDDYPVAIAWNGASYLAVYVEHGGPGRGGVLRTRRLTAGGAPLDEQPGRILSLLNQYNVTGRLLWTGTEYILILHASQISSSSDNLFRLRLSAGGTPFDSVSFPPALVSGGSTTVVQSAFGAALASPSRAVVVYGKSAQSLFGARVYTTTNDFAALPKQRAAGRR